MEKKLPKLTFKQEIFVDEYVKTGNGQNSALKAYNIKSEDKENVARSVASQTLTNLNVLQAIEIKKETLRSALEKQGVTPAKIAKKIDKLLESEDDSSVDKGLKHATNIYGVEELEKPRINSTYNFIFNKETQEEIKKIEEVIKGKLINATKNKENNPTE